MKQKKQKNNTNLLKIFLSCFLIVSVSSSVMRFLEEEFLYKKNVLNQNEINKISDEDREYSNKIIEIVEGINDNNIKIEEDFNIEKDSLLTLFTVKDAEASELTYQEYKNNLIQLEKDLTVNIDEVLSEELSGKILIQTENYGAGWYVYPENNSRYYLGNPEDAFEIMRELGLGVSGADFNSWGDTAPSKLSGMILLNVDDQGKSYYIDPESLEMHYLGTPEDAFNLMKELGLGITNQDIRKIRVGIVGEEIIVEVEEEQVIEEEDVNQEPELSAIDYVKKQSDIINTEVEKVEFENYQEVYNTKDFEILDTKTGNILSNIPADEKIQIRYSIPTESYLVTKNGMIYVQSKNGIKLKNTNNGVFHLDSNSIDKDYVTLIPKIEEAVVTEPVDNSSETNTDDTNTNTDNETNIDDTNTDVNDNTENNDTIISENNIETIEDIEFYNHPYVTEEFKIKVGVTYKTMPAIIQSTRQFNVENEAGNIYLVVNANEEIKIYFEESSDKYIVEKEGTKIVETNDYLKFVNSDDRGVFEIVNFENRPSWNQSLNYNKYRGDLELRHNDVYDRTWVVNEVYMSDYLKGSSESSNGNDMEYLKTMAVAQRTYATYHYLTEHKNYNNEHFHVWATTMDQAYSGYEREIRQPNVVQAVEDTRGIYVIYDDKIIEALYSANAGGETRLVSEVWGGSDVPYLQKMEDPYTADDTRYGHGIGVSQVGAKGFITNENYNFIDVLTYYYTNVTLNKLYN
ncbi:SpoIID/LytB domain-containing protein [Patescibacteria group bacterium]|nr:SpoIID/LytB domain-containing protein [Patescibacteria group bacterium]